jgi:hypothetical protein
MSNSGPICHCRIGTRSSATGRAQRIWRAPIRPRSVRRLRCPRLAPRAPRPRPPQPVLRRMSRRVRVSHRTVRLHTLCNLRLPRRRTHAPARRRQSGRLPPPTALRLPRKRRPGRQGAVGVAGATAAAAAPAAQARARGHRTADRSSRMATRIWEAMATAGRPQTTTRQLSRLPQRPRPPRRSL